MGRIIHLLDKLAPPVGARQHDPPYEGLPSYQVQVVLRVAPLGEPTGKSLPM